MAILIEPPVGWDNIEGKPTILSDNQIYWNEIQGIPERIDFLANTIPQNWNPWILADFYGERLEWMPLKSEASPWTMVQRGSSGGITGSSFKATNLPTDPTGLSVGNFYRDETGFVKVIF